MALPTTMSTNPASHNPSDIMITTDIDFTADLATGPPVTLSTSVSDRAGARAPLPPPSGDVPFHDEVPAAARAERLPVAPGRVLCDRFVLTKLLATGGTCCIYLARDLEADRNREKPSFVALKTPRADCKDRARAIARLQREFEHARRLSHAGIVQVYELANEGDIWFMTMELLEGESLASLMRRQRGALPPFMVRRVLRGTAEALAYAHAGGVAHGDLNPANIFMLTGERVKLLDFGAACANEQAPTAAATVAYASPQVLEGMAPQIRDDVFCFACIAYQVLTGAHPFQQRSSIVARDEGLRPQAPAHLSNDQNLALMAALSWDRDARPDDVRALTAALAPEAQRRRVAFEPAPYEPAYQPRDDRRWWLLGGMCLVAMIIAIVLTRTA
jgi:serine/threonine protein kinase